MKVAIKMKISRFWFMFYVFIALASSVVVSEAQEVTISERNTNIKSITKSRTHEKASELPSNKKKYRHPSIMVEEDKRSGYVNGKEIDGVLMSIIVKRWRTIYDKYGRPCQYISPKITYAELRNTLNFDDSDVVKVPSQMTYNEIQDALKYHDDVLVDKSRKPGIPHAYIRTDWLTCTITYLDKQYDGTNENVRLEAVVIDNKEQAAAEAHAAADKKNNILNKIINFFKFSPH
jgi:hypothetical protein